MLIKRYLRDCEFNDHDPTIKLAYDLDHIDDKSMNQYQT